MARLARAIQSHERRRQLPWMAHVKWAMTMEGAALNRRRQLEFDHQPLAIAFIAALAARLPAGMQQDHA